MAAFVVLMVCAGGAMAATLTQVVQFSAADLGFSREGMYDVVTLSGDPHLTLVGNPMLPYRVVHLAIPSGTTVIGVEARAAETQSIPGRFLLFPAQPPQPLSLDAPDPSFTPPDKAVYGSSRPFPAALAEFVRQADVAGQSLASFRVYPLQYQPVSRELTLHSRVELVVTLSEGGPVPQGMNRMSENTRRTYETMVKGMVLNPEGVVVEPRSGPSISALPAGDFDHVVITTSTYSTSFNSLVAWNKKKGIPDTVVTTDYIYSHYSGIDNQEMIRNFIKDANTTWGTIWFLLGGDSNVIPVKTKYFSITGENVPGDMYYSDYDDDWVCELFVGRASIDNTSQVATFVDKVLTYEKTPPTTNYPLEALLAGFNLDSSTRGENCKTDIDNLYIPSRFDPVNKVYDSYSGNHRDAVISNLNAGQNLFNHIDHASQTYMGTGYVNHNWGLYNSDMTNLTNGDRQAILYSIGCDCGQFTYYTECIAEAFVQNPNGGGVGSVANTCYGWYNPGSTNSLSMLYDRAFFKSLFTDNMYKLGQTVADHKNDHPPGSDQYLRYIVWELCLLGEPELGIWTDTPTAVTVSHPTTINVGSQSYTVTVTYNSSPLANALVCVYKGAEVYAYGLTGTNGQKTFTINPLTAGTMSVTVTAQNHLPYEGTCTVGGQPAVALTLNRTSSDPHSRGGTLSYNAVFTNNTASPQTVYYWAEVKLPNQRTRRAVPAEAVTVPVPSYTKSYQHTIPMNAPYGSYTYTGYISTTPYGPLMGQSSYTFTIQ
jgi:hypothetical protein